MEEDIKLLKDKINFCKNNTECRDELNQCFGCAFEVEEIQAIENLIARNEELEEWYELFNKTSPEKMKIIVDSFHEIMAQKFDKEFIPKSKIKEKIDKYNAREKKELKGLKGQDRYFVKQMYQYMKQALQELLD